MCDAHSWNIWLSRFVLTLADHIPLQIRMLSGAVRGTAREIDRYFNNTDGVGSKIRDLLKQTLRPMLEQQNDVLLIGHSLGSVIAYDTLWELSHRDGMKGKVDFLTLGSPMGLHYMQRRLLGMNGNSKKSYPELIRWVNFSAEGDVTALNENLKDSFYPMLEPGLPSLLKTIVMGYTIFAAAMRGFIAIAHMATW